MLELCTNYKIIKKEESVRDRRFVLKHTNRKDDIGEYVLVEANQYQRFSIGDVVKLELVSSKEHF